MSRHEILDSAGAARVAPNICALGIMTKAPEAGKVKTRLIPPLTAQEASELNVCFLHDLGRSINLASRQGLARGVGVYTPVGAEAAYENVLPDGFFLLPQRGSGFGERLSFAAQDLFKLGFASVCLINSDSPTVPASSFEQAASELAKPGDRVVLGPSLDGGYYLIGLKQMHKRVFEEIDWSTESVLGQTVERAMETGINVHLLPGGFDVDDRSALGHLCDELLGDNRISTQAAPSTRQFLAKIIECEGRERIWPVL